jgi:hypothetical protein
MGVDDEEKSRYEIKSSTFNLTAGEDVLAEARDLLKSRKREF